MISQAGSGLAIPGLYVGRTLVRVPNSVFVSLGACGEAQGSNRELGQIEGEEVKDPIIHVVLVPMYLTHHNGLRYEGKPDNASAVSMVPNRQAP
jgi:hypothetical protein